MKYLNLFFILSIAIVLLNACQSNSTKKVESDDAIDMDVDVDSKDAEKTVKKVFFNLPSPVELTQTILSSDQPFNTELLNSVDNISNYTSSASLALNFGVYGADLCYCRVYEQLQESISYLSVIRRISDKLQIPEDEGAETINRIEESLENRDSIFQIIADTYAGADGYLKENERDATAAYILIGGWVEGMYFATNIASNNKTNTKVINRIAEQKYSLGNLISLISDYKNNPIIGKIVPILYDLQKVYDEVNITHEKPVVVTDSEDNVTTIDNKAKIDISVAQIEEITRMINEIRSIIIS